MTHLNTFAIRAIYRFEMARTFRTLVQSIISPVVSTSLYFVVFGSAIGSRIPEVGGVSYGAFIVPGLIMLSILTESISNASFGIYFPKFTGTIYELLSAPISPLETVLGYVGAAATKSIVLGLVILATAAFFGLRNRGSVERVRELLRLGVAGLISPWNLPLYLLSWKIAPAIAAIVITNVSFVAYINPTAPPATARGEELVAELTQGDAPVEGAIGGVDAACRRLLTSPLQAGSVEQRAAHDVGPFVLLRRRRVVHRVGGCRLRVRWPRAARRPRRPWNRG